MAKEEGVISDLRDRVTVYATKKAPFHKEGEAIKAHPETAKYFVKSGYATEKKGAKAE